MSLRQTEFTTAVIGSVASRLNLPLSVTYNRLKEAGIISSFIVPGYDVLHTFSREYVADDVIALMKEKGVPIC